MMARIGMAVGAVSMVGGADLAVSHTRLWRVSARKYC